MQFSCDRKELLTAARRATKAAAPRTTPVPALSGILLQADASNFELTLTATNLEIAISSSVAAPVSESGGVVVDAGLLADMLSLLEGQTIEVQSQPGNQILLSGGNASYLVAGLSEKAFPILQIPDGSPAVQVSRLNGLARQTVFAAAKSDSTPLRCVKLEIRPDHLRAIGCDGNLLSFAKREVSGSQPMELLIPSSSFSVLTGLAGEDDQLLLTADDKQAVFRCPQKNWIFSTQLGMGSYLDVDAVLTGIDKRYEAITDAASLKQVLGEMTVLSNTDSAIPPLICLTFSSGEISVSAENEYGSARDAIAAQVSTPTPPGGFYYLGKKLLLGLRAMGGEIRLSLSGSGILLATCGEQTFLLTPNCNPSLSASKRAKVPKKSKGQTKKAKAA